MDSVRPLGEAPNLRPPRLDALLRMLRQPGSVPGTLEDVAAAEGVVTSLESKRSLKVCSKMYILLVLLNIVI